MTIVLVTLMGPAERTLGSTARIIFIHGAMVWTAMAAFAVAALVSFIALLVRRSTLEMWSCAIGRVALLFWLGYLPLSMWAARAAWGRIFISDPSFQRAFRVLAVALIVQVLVWFRPRPGWFGSLLNLLPFVFMVIQFSGAQQLMHPNSPIKDSNSALIQVYFILLSGLCALLAAALAHWLFDLQRTSITPGRNSPTRIPPCIEKT